MLNFIKLDTILFLFSFSSPSYCLARLKEGLPASDSSVKHVISQETYGPKQRCKWRSWNSTSISESSSYFCVYSCHSRQFVPTMGKYIGPFEEYYRKHGIKHETIVLKTPLENGLTERMNCTICKKVWGTISYAKWPKIFWGDHVYRNRIINLSSTFALDMDVPEPVWMENDVSYKHVKVSDVDHFLTHWKMKVLSLMVRLNHASILKSHKRSLVTDCGI